MNKYKIEMVFNGETFSKTIEDKKDIKEAILSFKPDFVHTEGYINITHGDANFQRKLTLIKLRKLFADPQDLELFTSTLMF